MSDTTQQYDGRLYTQPEVDRLMAHAVAEAKYNERFKILNRISTMRIDIAREAIRNGRVEIMHHIADKLRQELTIQESTNNLTPETPCLDDQPL